MEGQSEEVTLEEWKEDSHVKSWRAQGEGNSMCKGPGVLKELAKCGVGGREQAIQSPRGLGKTLWALELSCLGFLSWE